MMGLKERRRLTLDLGLQLDRDLNIAASRNGQSKANYIRTCIMVGMRWLELPPWTDKPPIMGGKPRP